MKLNIERLKNNLLELAKIGSQGDKGITRIAYTPEYKEANNFIKNLMEEAGLETGEDSVGNLFGSIKGSKSERKIIMGSHIDTVSCGGPFDGSLGVIAAVETLQTLIEYEYNNRYTLEAAVFIGEEGKEAGGAFGSRCFSGEIEPGRRELNYIKKVGLTPEDIKLAKIKPQLVKNFLELHIEQGRVLETEGKSIGIVKGIVGILRYKSIITGQANHSGTTPMHLRDDALIKASKTIIKLNEIINSIGGSLVGTVGDVVVTPGTVNVIPGKVEFPIELRAMSVKEIQKTIDLLKEETEGLDLMLEELVYEREAYLDKEVQSCIQQACEKLDYRYKFMVSGAGYDSNTISRIAPTGMIFVPSKAGISHSPEEWTYWKDVEKGANVMLQTLLSLDE